MSKIRYCSLEEAWGEIPTPINTKQSLEKDARANLPTSDVNFNCQKEPMKNYPTQNLEVANTNEVNNMRDKLDPSSRTLLNTMDHLQVKYGITKNDYNSLLEQFSNVINNINKTEISKEDFSNQYAPYQNNQSYDILFLILLGLFVIYVLDKR